MRGNDAEFPQEHDAADWESDDGGVLWARLNCELEAGESWAGLRHAFDDASLTLTTSAHPDADTEVEAVVRLCVADDDAQGRYSAVEFDADGAERLAAQLQLAAELARGGEGADVRA